MKIKNDISSIEIDNDPFTLFEKWYKEHLATGSAISDSVNLGTASSSGVVSVRTVLLKGFDEKGFVFYTNYNSKKGSQLLSNQKAALLFYWSESGRQVRIEGSVKKVSEKESALYFQTRPRESQLSAWASEQSSVIPDRQHLENCYELYQNKFYNQPVEKPPYWGGFRVIPEWFEFWQNGEFRLHDRFSYTLQKETWLIERLAP